jgi:magnesium-transporting ATPase (P-type)
LASYPADGSSCISSNKDGNYDSNKTKEIRSTLILEFHALLSHALLLLYITVYYSTAVSISLHMDSQTPHKTHKAYTGWKQNTYTNIHTVKHIIYRITLFYFTSSFQTWVTFLVATQMKNKNPPPFPLTIPMLKTKITCPPMVN